MIKKNIAPIHPGEILLEEFMKPMNISQYKLAKQLHVGAIRISEIIYGKRSIISVISRSPARIRAPAPYKVLKTKSYTMLTPHKLNLSPISSVLLCSWSLCCFDKMTCCIFMQHAGNKGLIGQSFIRSFLF